MKKILSLSFIFWLINTTTVNADDTEIFTGTSSSGGGMNAIFLLDTSGSMSKLEELKGFEDYNPNKNYQHSDYGFDSTSHYIFRPGAINETLNLTSDEITRLKEHEIDVSQYNCRSNAAISNLDTYGYTTGRFAFFNTSNGWTAPNSDNELLGSNPPAVDKSSSSIIQCKESERLGGDYSYQGSSYEELSNFSHYSSSGERYADYGWFFNTSDFFNWPSGYTIIFSGNYLNYLGQKGSSDNPNSTYKMRLDIVADAAKEVIAANEDPNLNISLMRFSSDGEGGFVGIPLTPATELSTEFSNEIDSYDPSGGTPITESIWEAYLYLSEQNVSYGLSAKTDNVAGDIFRVNNTGGTDPDNQTFTTDYGNVNPYGQYPTSYSSNSTYYINNSTESASASTENSAGIKYKLPDTGECGVPDQKIILFSDGDASSDVGVNSLIQTKLNIFDTLPSGLSFSCSGDGGCADELAYYLGSEERRTQEGAPLLTIDTMGGFLDGEDTAEDLLIAIKDQANGSYYPVSSEEDIKLALAEATTVPIESPSTFTAPAIAVSSYNSLQISDELYYSVFEPNNTGAWAGNLKRYRISSKGVVDSIDKSAIDSSNGYFSDEAVSFWSNTMDGAKVREGGVAERFIDTPRNIKLINESGNLLNVTPDLLMNLTGDPLGIDAAGLSSTLLNIADNITYELGLANWISGLTEDGTSNRQEMEDAIHSRPVVINYSNSKRIVYIGTNSGYLHAFDTSTGQEVFSILPYEVLTNAIGYLKPEETTVLDKIYGLDGPITYWHNDSNLNGIVDGAEKVFLYVGMRRGGHSYYAFDITEPSNPSVQWMKHGPYTDTSKNVPAVSNGYSRLGQTWSSLKPALVKWGGDDKVVLFTGGGYDPNEDGSSNTRIQSNVGNTVYMIDAINGNVLWSAYDDVSGASTDMTNSFPADVSPVDRNSDGYVDLLYASDMGGRVWRFDLIEKSSSFSGGVIADINTSATTGVSDNRRFYVRPDVSFINTIRTIPIMQEDGSITEVNKEDKFLLVSIGSGYRAHPLSEEVNDHFYMFKDTHGLNYPEAYTTVGVSNLAEWSSNAATTEEGTTYGWYFNPQNTGEKILSPSITLNGVLTFNTFALSNDETEVSCSGNLGISRTYQFALSEEILNRISCSDDCQTIDLPGENGTPSDIVSRLKPDPTLVMPNPEDRECPEGETCDPLTCNDYAISILSGTTLTEGNMDRCDLFETYYWEEEL